MAPRLPGVLPPSDLNAPHAQLDAAAVADGRPAVGGKAHRRQERLAAQVVEAPALRPDAKEHRPGRPVIQLDEIGVAGRLDRVLGPVPVRQDRVAREGLERSERGRAARDDLHAGVVE